MACRHVEMSMTYRSHVTATFMEKKSEVFLQSVKELKSNVRVEKNILLTIFLALTALEMHYCQSDLFGWNIETYQ